MKTKTIFSVSIWVVIVVVSIFYFASQNTNKENEILAIEKSSKVLKKSIQLTHQDRYLNYLFHAGYAIIGSERERYTFFNLKNAHKLAELRYKKGVISLDDMKEYPLTNNKFYKKVISQNDSNHCLDSPLKQINKLYLYQNLMNFADDETFQNISYWATGYSTLGVEVIENDKIGIRLTDIFHPEPIEYYLR
ncbi:hypothetical protein [Bernardetia sp.]|uniref:hypothetical protein n=1 Tax=Bernardetia sp. TaxID=1937974 RepID=UPI0025BB1D56|nr:hypothetical protein [Bernardetia sp.]